MLVLCVLTEAYDELTIIFDTIYVILSYLSMLETDTDPIVAIATAPGRGGIGVIRMSFGKANQAAAYALMSAACNQQLKPRYATYVPFLDAQGNVLDRGIGLYFPAPHSYTGEHVVELQGHGGPVVLQLLLQRCLEVGHAMQLGLRLAAPGEFTYRAFLNNKLDLVQAEAVADLIEASTEAAARSAGRSLNGAFSTAIYSLTDNLIQLRMHVEALLDFPEEETDALGDIRGQLAKLQHAIDDLQHHAQQGALLRHGLSVVLVGQPNVGKSSLLNTLVGAELAIVTPMPGTTRDKVVQTIQIEGIPLHLIDTAGLRNTEDPVERIGVDRTWQEAKQADVVLHLLDARVGITDEDKKIIARLPSTIPMIQVFNKIDLTGERPAITRVSTPRTVRVSAKTTAGIDLLRAQLLDIAGWQTSAENVYLARGRHLAALHAAHRHLTAAADHIAQDTPAIELFAEELRLIQEQLNTIVGKFTSDDLLGEIFSRFCIGK